MTTVNDMAITAMDDLSTNRHQDLNWSGMTARKAQAEALTMPCQGGKKPRLVTDFECEL